ncbi:mitochondrial assembly of ribosomal large subunit protein 1 isoform X2 [Girardinichthys multiradiatus]|uniref:mitochondrial assembly of ribosomal large subunit protein 1 isoform X2 n=1 Tax=Girardinichthys multiradiatus TaxID=208333 RepID=UPI001FAB39B9|nr:mitochondrial assembly of ribosomal large subunit protein 1 isoform X2 [Girardinichthys multiradiatus]
MSFMCRFRILISSVCRKSSLLDDSAMSRCLSMFSKARCHRLPVELSSCQQHWRQGASPRCLFESKRRYTDRGFSETFNLDVLVSLLRQENAVDLCVIKVPDHIQYAEYFIVVSGVSPRHLRAMALYAIKVYKFLRKDGELHVKIEGKGADDWMCVDFGNMVVHLMLPETREVYELEKLWTLRAYDEQLRKIPSEMLPEDFVFDAELTK